MVCLKEQLNVVPDKVASECIFGEVINQSLFLKKKKKRTENELPKGKQMDLLVVIACERAVFSLSWGSFGLWESQTEMFFEVVQTCSAWSTPRFNLCGDVLLFHSPR